MILEGEGLAELHTHLGGSVASDILWSIAHEQGIALPVQGLLGVRRARHRLGSARRAGSRRARPDLPLDGAHPVLAARSRALGARRDWRRVPLAANHDARAALQPDEAEPRRRARPRPHHPRRDPRRRSREHRVPAGPRRAHPDDGSHLRPAAQRDHRREGDQLGRARSRRRRHRRPAPRRRPLRLRADRVDRRDRPRRRARRDHPRRRRGRRHGARRDRRRRRAPAARPHRARHPRRAGREPHGVHPRPRDHARDLPDLEPPHEGAARRGRRA